MTASFAAICTAATRLIQIAHANPGLRPGVTAPPPLRGWFTEWLTVLPRGHHFGMRHTLSYLAKMTLTVVIVFAALPEDIPVAIHGSDDEARLG